MKLSEVDARIYRIKEDFKRADAALKQRIINRLRASSHQRLIQLADELENIQTLVSWLKPG